MKRSKEISDMFDMAWEGCARRHLAPGAPTEIFKSASAFRLS